MKIQKMQRRIEKIKMALQNVGEMRPGSINKQLTICGRPGCKCQDSHNPKKHGPYYQLSYVHKGKSTTQFIQKQLVKSVSRQLKNFKLFKELTNEWVELALAIAKEKLNDEKINLKTRQKISSS